ncbi:Hypothetical protein PHPALM_6086 [Phytophthora palmivora]|uniref:Reverse transcriptase Ty1/copia-type domain-containing protein n=1 Tax=Phytophthora palmivora TaxID=4796 RepID=A0A2P4YFP9_9STRA|nr:Hypothetical protein PHPALM_6086 [Phytophthora palmivora]
MEPQTLRKHNLAQMQINGLKHWSKNMETSCGTIQAKRQKGANWKMGSDKNAFCAWLCCTLPRQDHNQRMPTAIWCGLLGDICSSSCSGSSEIRPIAALHIGLSSRHVDFVTAFLNGSIEKDIEIYIGMPEYFDNGSDRVCKLLRSLCGLKPAS